jgi:probable rRNA maturation factor
MEIDVLNRQRSRRVSTAALQAFLRKVVREVPAADADGFTICLVSDRRMRGYNRAYRGVDGTTDVLSFEGDSRPGPDGRIHLGDIVIAVPAAARQARRLGHSLAREIKILSLHGYLHLLGYDHDTDGGTMNRLQRKVVSRLLPRVAARRRN